MKGKIFFPEASFCYEKYFKYVIYPAFYKGQYLVYEKRKVERGLKKFATDNP